MGLDRTLCLAHQDVAGNGLVDTATQSAQASPFTVGPLPAGTTSSTFYVRRAAAGQPVTLPVTITDACGRWTTRRLSRKTSAK